MNPVARLICWPIAAMLAINLSRTVVDTRMAKVVRLVLLLILLGIVYRANAGELPNAPSHSMRAPIETYSPDEQMIVHNTPARSKEDKFRVFDWQFVAVHGVYAGSLVFDDLVTSRGVANGCAEANPDLGPRPSSKQLALHGLLEFGLVVGGDAGLKALGRHMDAPVWLSRTFGSLAAAIGTGKHIRGGYAWTQTNCL